MKIKNFFAVRSKLLSSTFKAPPIGLEIDNDINLVEGNYERINFPVIFKQSCGKNLTDILDTEYISLYLISDRMKRILEKNKLTGWKIYPIKLYDNKEKEIFGYHGFSVTGHCGAIDYKKSEIIEKRRIPTGPICKFYKGLHIGLDQWNETDFFIPENILEIIITKRAAEVLKNEKITNMDLENLSDYEISFIAAGSQ